MPNQSSVCPHSIERQEMQRTVPYLFHFAYNKSYQDPRKGSCSDSNINSLRPLELFPGTRPKGAGTFGMLIAFATSPFHEQPFQDLPWEVGSRSLQSRRYNS